MRRVGWVLAVLMLSASMSFAQGGGKAEPTRVELKRGSQQTTVTGRVTNDQEVEYVLAAKKGQRLSIRLSSIPTKATVFDLKALGDADLGLEYNANWSFNKVLPVSGDYLITVARPTSEKGQASFKLVITVK